MIDKEYVELLKEVIKSHKHYKPMLDEMKNFFSIREKIIYNKFVDIIKNDRTKLLALQHQILLLNKLKNEENKN